MQTAKITFPVPFCNQSITDTSLNINENMFNLEEAFVYAKRAGRPVMKKDLAKLLWPDATPEAQVINMSNLCAGKTARIRPEWIPIICRELGVTPEFLLGM